MSVRQECRTTATIRFEQSGCHDSHDSWQSHESRVPAPQEQILKPKRKRPRDQRSVVTPVASDGVRLPGEITAIKIGDLMCRPPVGRFVTHASESPKGAPSQLSSKAGESQTGECVADWGSFGVGAAEAFGAGSCGAQHTDDPLCKSHVGDMKDAYPERCLSLGE